jgi:hypothetical protein
MKDEGEAESLPKQIADLLSWPCVLTSLAMLGYSSLVVGSLALATPFMVPNIYLKCKGAERNTNIEAKDVMLLVKDTRSARLIVPDKHEQQDANREQGKSCWQLLKEGCNSFWRCAMS